jgi:hypothetical protein
MSRINPRFGRPGHDRRYAPGEIIYDDEVPMHAEAPSVAPPIDAAVKGIKMRREELSSPKAGSNGNGHTHDEAAPKTGDGEHKGHNGGSHKSDDGFIREGERILKDHHKNIRHAIALLGVSLRHNDFSTQTEISNLSAFGPELTDAGAIRLRFLIQETYGFLAPLALYEAVLTDIAHMNRYHPVRDFLAGLKWDGVPRIDTWLTTYAGAEDTAFNRAAGRIFLIAGVRRVRQPGVKFDTMIVFESPQGKDKSKALRALAIKGEWFTDNLPLSADPKQVIEATGGVWIAEFAELDGITKRDVGHVKNFLSKQDDRARPAYGRRSERVPRQFIAAGSTNDSQYLIDYENRRFWPVTIKRFDSVALTRDAEQLWAEAAHYEAEGEPITLPEDLWAAAAEVQADREIDNPIRDFLATAFGSQTGWLPASDIWPLLNVPLDRRLAFAVPLGKAMLALGFERKQARHDGKRPGLKKDERYYERGTNAERDRRIFPYPEAGSQTGSQTGSRSGSQVW